MVALRCFFAIEINLMEFIVCGQYILAYRYLRNSDYVVEHEVLSTFQCQFSSKRSFQKPKNTEVCLKFEFKMAALRSFFATEINLVQCILSGQYILAVRFLRNSGYMVEHEVLSTFECQFSFKEGLRNLKIPTFA